MAYQSLKPLREALGNLIKTLDDIVVEDCSALKKVVEDVVTVKNELINEVEASIIPNFEQGNTKENYITIHSDSDQDDEQSSQEKKSLSESENEGLQLDKESYRILSLIRNIRLHDKMFEVISPHTLSLMCASKKRKEKKRLKTTLNKLRGQTPHLVKRIFNLQERLQQTGYCGNIKMLTLSEWNDLSSTSKCIHEVKLRKELRRVNGLDKTQSDNKEGPPISSKCPDIEVGCQENNSELNNENGRNENTSTCEDLQQSMSKEISMNVDVATTREDLEDDFLFNKSIPAPSSYSSLRDLIKTVNDLPEPDGSYYDYVHLTTHYQTLLLALTNGRFPEQLSLCFQLYRDRMNMRTIARKYLNIRNKLSNVIADFPKQFYLNGKKPKPDLVAFARQTLKCISHQCLAKFKMIDAKRLRQLPVKSVCQYLLYLEEIRKTSFEEDYLFNKNIPIPTLYPSLQHLLFERFVRRKSSDRMELIHFIRRTECLILVLSSGNLPDHIETNFEKMSLQTLETLYRKSFRMLLKVQANFRCYYEAPVYSTRECILEFASSFQYHLKYAQNKNFHELAVSELNKISQKDVCQYILYLLEIWDASTIEEKKKKKNGVKCDICKRAVSKPEDHLGDLLFNSVRSEELASNFAVHCPEFFSEPAYCDVCHINFPTYFTLYEHLLGLDTSDRHAIKSSFNRLRKKDWSNAIIDTVHLKVFERLKRDLNSFLNDSLYS